MNKKSENKRKPGSVGTLKRFTSRGRPNTSLEKKINAKPDVSAQTTVLTMFVSGTAPGDFSKTYRTITLRSLQSNTRLKREAISHTDLPSLKPPVPDLPNADHTNKVASKLDPEEIVSFLKTLDKEAVEDMMRSLKKWVHYYSSQLLESEIKSNTPVLSSSLSSSTEPFGAGTAALPLATPVLPLATPVLPLATPVSGETASTVEACPAAVTVTHTVYRTVNN